MQDKCHSSATAFLQGVRLRLSALCFPWGGTFCFCFKINQSGWQLEVIYFSWDADRGFNSFVCHPHWMRATSSGAGKLKEAFIDGFLLRCLSVLPLLIPTNLSIIVM